MDQKTKLDHAVSLLQRMLVEIDTFRNCIFQLLNHYMVLNSLSNEKVATHLQSLSALILEGGGGLSQDYAYCVLSLFWSLSSKQLERFALQNVMSSLPNAKLADSTENPFIPGKIMTSPSIASRFQAFDRQYKVDNAALKCIFRQLYSSQFQAGLFLQLRCLLDSLPTVTVKRALYHRSHECGVVNVNHLTISIGIKASYRQTLAHELAHIIYRRYFVTSKKSFGGRSLLHTEKRVLSTLLREMWQNLPNTKRLSFLKLLLNNNHYQYKQKSEEFFCELFALLATHPEYLNTVSQVAPNAFTVFSQHLHLMVNRMKFLRRENLIAPSLSDLLKGEEMIPNNMALSS